MSVNELARANGINKNAILRPGQRLNVRPPGGGVVRVASTSTPQADGTTTREMRYKVRRGDTLSSIARRFDVSVRQLQDWNGMGGSTALRAGQNLTIHVNGARDYGG